MTGAVNGERKSEVREVKRMDLTGVCRNRQAGMKSYNEEDMIRNSGNSEDKPEMEDS